MIQSMCLLYKSLVSSIARFVLFNLWYWITAAANCAHALCDRSHSSACRRAHSSRSSLCGNWTNKAAARAYENVCFRRPCPSEASRVFVHQSVSVRSDAIGAAHGHFCFVFFSPSLALRIHGYQRNKQKLWARLQQQDWNRVLAFVIIHTNYAARGSNCGLYCSPWRTQST